MIYIYIIYSAFPHHYNSSSLPFFLHMSTCVCVYVCVCVSVSVCVCACVCACTHVRASVRVSVYVEAHDECVYHIIMRLHTFIKHAFDKDPCRCVWWV